MKITQKQLAALVLLMILLIVSVGFDFTADEASESVSENNAESAEKIAYTDSNTEGYSVDNLAKLVTQSLDNESKIESENMESSSPSSNYKEQSNPEEKSDVKKISLSFTEVTLIIGESRKLTAVVEPSDSDDNDISWTSSDDKIAKMGDDGNINAYSEGNCIIKGRLISDSSVTASVYVTVCKKQENPSSDIQSDSDSTVVSNTQANETKKQVSSISLSFYEAVMNVGETIVPQVTMKPDNAYDKAVVWTSSDKSIASVDGHGNITAHSDGTCYITVSSESNPSVSEDIHITVLKAQEEEKTKPDTPQTSAGETYINGILVVNKTYPLPYDYNPGGLTQECSAQFELLRQGAAQDGVNIYLSSGFRSYDTQRQLYNDYVNCYGQQAADTFSARPGHSEHQTGLAIDCNIINDSFIGTPEAVWLAEHCYEYGFIIRYPQGKESITGYKYEPWHIRYVGVDLARDIYSSGLTLEEYLGITSEYDY